MLNPDQRQFIETKVKRLGNLEAVKRDYRRNDLVSKYALEVAEKLYNQPVLRRRDKI